MLLVIEVNNIRGWWSWRACYLCYRHATDTGRHKDAAGPRERGRSVGIEQPCRVSARGRRHDAARAPVRRPPHRPVRRPAAHDGARAGPARIAARLPPRPPVIISRLTPFVFFVNSVSKSGGLVKQKELRLQVSFWEGTMSVQFFSSFFFLS